MEEQNQHIDQYFRENLGDYTEQPDASVWTELEKRLDEKPRRRGMLWIWLLAFLVATGITLFSYKSYHTGRSDNPATVSYNSPAHHTATSTKNVTTPPATGNDITAQPVIQAATSSVPAHNSHKKTAAPVQPAPALQPTDLPGHPVNAPVAQVSKNTAIPASSPATDKDQLQAHTPVTTPGSSQPDITPSPTASISKDPLPVAPKTIPTPTGETDYMELKPIAGKIKISEAAKQPDPREYDNLVPSAGKHTTGKTASPAIAEKPATETAVVQRAVPASPAVPVENVHTLPAAKPDIIKDSPKETPIPVAVAKTGGLQQEVAMNSSAGSIAEQENKKPHIRRFSAGIKAGYESGTSRPGANKWVASASLQYHFNPRLSLMLQPAVKYAKYTAAELSRSVYYRITDTSRTDYTPGGGIVIPSSQDHYIIYKETYDSIIITQDIPAVHKWQFDIPLLLNYKLLRNLEIYGGPQINIASVIQSVTNTRTVSITRADTVLVPPYTTTGGQFDTPPMGEVFTHTVPQYGGYTGTGTAGVSSGGRAYAAQSSISPVRLGLTIGASYTFRQRFMLDIQYIQAVTGMKDITEQKVRNIYSQPYIRMTLGYRFIK